MKCSSSSVPVIYCSNIPAVYPAAHGVSERDLTQLGRNLGKLPAEDEGRILQLEQESSKSNELFPQREQYKGTKLREREVMRGRGLVVPQ